MESSNIIERIGRFERFGSVLGLERLEELLHRLGDPQEGKKYIHVAGTNGKGSVCKFLEKGLAECGYRVGLYISPYIEVFHERIQCDGTYISEEQLVRCGNRAIEAAESMVRDGLTSPTEFEVVMAIAFLFFDEQDPDIIILETGMGGTGDATNIIRHPLACAITSISYDHMDVLGDTLAKIAGEKAGIIKDGAPVISNVPERESAAVIAKAAYERGSRLYDISSVKTAVLREDPAEQTVSMQLLETDYSDVVISMAGRHQAENLKTALAVIEVLRRARAIRVERSALYRGLRKAVQPARFEIVEGRQAWLQEGRYAPMIIIDGAHNEAGAAALAETASRYFEGRKLLLVTGILADKEVDRVVAQFAKITDQVLVTSPDSPRKLGAAELAEKFRGLGIEPVGLAETAEECVPAVRRIQSGYDVILFAGSLYLAGTVRRMIRNGQREEEK